MSSDENTDDQSDHTDLPATIPYDYLDSNLSSPPPVQGTIATVTPTTNTAPHTGSTPFSTFSTYQSSSGTTQEHLDSKQLREASSQADRRLFRSRSNNLEADIGTKRKFGHYNSESAVQQRNLERGYSDLSNIASTRSLLPGYSDVQPFRGQIDQTQRYYLEKDITVEGLAASLDSSNISSGETILHLDGRKRSFITVSVDNSLEQCRDNSFSHSDHSSNSLPTNTTSSISGPELQSSASDKGTEDTAPIATTEDPVDTTAVTETSNIYQVESSCPIDDLDFRQGLEGAENDDDADKDYPQGHLHGYSPESIEDFAQQVSLQPSSTPLRPQIGSTFPDDDFDNLQQAVRNDEFPNGDDDDDNDTDNDDIAPPCNQRLKTPSLQNIDNMASPFLDQQQDGRNQHQSHGTRSTKQNTVSTAGSTDQTNSSAGPPLRRLRSNADLSTVAAAHVAPQYYIMFSSSIDIHKYRRSIEAMGATVVFNWDLCTHLVTDSVKKTTNLLCALASKRHIVSERWVEMSILKAHFEDEKDYVVIRQTGSNYFTNKKLYFQPSADIKRSDAQDLAKAAGAKLRVKQPDMVKCDPALIVIYSGTLKETRPYQKTGYETMKRDDFLKLYGQSDD
ncbi:unnamed protein product [Absidia cylindrospora]